MPRNRKYLSKDLKNARWSPWTEEEDEKLRAAYAACEAQETSKIFWARVRRVGKLGRTVAAIQSRAKALGLRSKFLPR